MEIDLEEWLVDDIDLLEQNLLVIGRQVRTDYGGYIDLLCLDREGNTVAIELKRGQTPRDVTAQALDYASWVSKLSHDQLLKHAGHNIPGWESLEVAFGARFETELPEVLNASHSCLIVAESMDDSTERIVKYLAELGVPINVATVQQFVDEDGKQMLAQVYLVEPEVAEANARRTSKRASQTVEGLRQIAADNDIGELWDHMRDSVKRLFNWIAYSDSAACDFKFDDGRFRTLFFSYTSSSEGKAGLQVTLHASRLSRFSGLDVEEIRELLPSAFEAADHTIRIWRFSSEDEEKNARGFTGHFTSKEEISRFIDALRTASQQR